MAEVVPNTVEKTPTADGSVNKPASGTYGEKAELDRLKQALPTGQTAPGGPGGPTPLQGPQPGPMPQDNGRPPNSTMPPGVPGALGHPTDRPNVPQSQRLQGPGVNPVTQAESARDARVATLMALTQSPSVSDATREWAQMVLEMING